MYNVYVYTSFLAMPVCMCSINCLLFDFPEFVNMDVFQPVFESLKVIDPRLMHPSACYDQMVPVMIKKILTKLEVRELLAQDIIHYHIIPRLTEEETKVSTTCNRHDQITI